MRWLAFCLVSFALFSACIPRQSAPPRRFAIAPAETFPPTWTPLPTATPRPASPTPRPTPTILGSATPEILGPVALLAPPPPITPHATYPPLLAYRVRVWEQEESRYVVWLYDPIAGDIVLRADDADGIRWSSTGRYLAIRKHWEGSKIVRLQIWDSQTNDIREVPIEKFDATRGFSDFLWSPDDQYLAIQSTVFGGSWGGNTWVDVIAGNGSGDSLIRLGYASGWYGHPGNFGGVYIEEWLPDNRLYTRELTSNRIVRTEITDIATRHTVMRGIGFDLLAVQEREWVAPPKNVESPDGRWLASRTPDRANRPMVRLTELESGTRVHLPLPDGADAVWEVLWRP